MIAAKPIDEFLDARGNRRIGGKSDSFLQVLNVRAGLPDVARLHRQQVPDRLLAERYLKLEHHLHEVDRGVIADVVDAPWGAARRRIRTVARPRGISLRHMI